MGNKEIKIIKEKTLTQQLIDKLEKDRIDKIIGSLFPDPIPKLPKIIVKDPPAQSPWDEHTKE